MCPIFNRKIPFNPLQSPKWNSLCRFCTRVFSEFLMIRNGLELMKTIVMYFDEHVVHVEVVVRVAMLTIAGHINDMDLMHSPPLGLMGTGIIVIAQALGCQYIENAMTLDPSAENMVDRRGAST